jgi:predicted Rossmann fold flavoprotein
MIYDIAIVGAGASGLMVATKLNNTTKKVVLIESASTIGNKIKISGGAKCNITNKYLDESKYTGDKDFVRKCLDKFDNTAMIKFLNNHNIYPKLNEKLVKGACFCRSSDDVLDMFAKTTTNIKKLKNFEVVDIELHGDIYHIISHTQTIKTKKLVVASGGKSFPSLGATDIAYKIATKFKHDITTTNPALVGLTVQKEQFWFKSLSGLSVDVCITIEDKTIYGSMLFTHKGISGPAVLSASLYWHKGVITIDFLPFKNSYIPNRLKKVFKQLNINPRKYSFAPAGNFGYTKAEATKGGINTKDIDDNFQSKLKKNLFFVGEALDITGELGGYNLHWAFCSGYICGQYLKNL